MSDENGGDRSQKTVAELLALHGGSAGNSRRRHRRAADEDDAAPENGRGVSDTAPQAIINRIKGEGGADEQADQHSAGQEHRPSRSAQRPSPQQPQPPAQQPPAQQPPAQQAQAPPPARPQPPRDRQGQPSPPPPQQQSRPLPTAPPPANGHAPQQQSQREQRAPQSNGTDSPATRLNGNQPRPAQQQRQEQTQEQQRQDQQRQGPVRGAEQPATEQPAAEPGGVEQGGAEPAHQPRSRGGFPWPPGGRRAPLRPAQRREPEPNTDQFPALGGAAGGQNGHQQANPEVSASAPPAGLAKWRQRRQQEQTEDTDVGVVPPVPADAAPASPADADGGPPTGAFTPTFDTGPQSAAVAEPGIGENVSGDAGYADYDYYDPDHAEQDYAHPDYDDETYDDYDEDGRAHADYSDEDEYTEFDEPVDERSPARQWLVLAGQLALGVVAGAGVWLGFSWLWGQLPSAALVAALLATLGLVWVIRRVRRAEDTQTTVLALLVGLVVTVSPAALLLVSR